MADKNYVDYKVTEWKRASFKDNADMQAVADMIKSGDFDNIFELDDFQDLSYVDGIYDEVMDPEENDGQNTIEVYKDEKIIYQNGK